MTNLIENVRREEERARNAERFRAWSNKWWHRAAKLELEAALRDEKAKLSGRLATAFDDFEDSAYRMGLIGLALFVLSLESCAPSPVAIADPILAPIPKPSACAAGVPLWKCAVWIEPGLMVERRAGE